MEKYKREERLVRNFGVEGSSIYVLLSLVK